MLLVSHRVNAGIAESLHARIMVERRIHAVNTYGVDSELLQEGEITSATSVVGEGINEVSRLLEWVGRARVTEGTCTGYVGRRCDLG